MGRRHLLRSRLHHRLLDVSQPRELDPRLKFHPGRNSRPPVRMPKPGFHANARQLLPRRPFRPIQLRLLGRNVYFTS